jgi:hypothetical protein
LVIFVTHKGDICIASSLLKEFEVRKTIMLSVAAVLATSCFGLATSKAADITVPNFSFESPAGPFAIQVSLTIDDWTTTGPPSEVVNVGNGPQNSGVGIFQNSSPGSPGYATNADGTQMAYMFSGSQDPTYNLHTLSQVLTTAFAANTQYTLTLGVSDAGGAPPPGDQLSLQLFYTTPAAPNTPVYLATTNVVQGTDSLSNTALTDYSATTPLLGQSGIDPAVGNDIGIIFTTTGVGGGEFNLDNVRLTATPEPGTLALLGLAAAPGLMRRRRIPR